MNAQAAVIANRNLNNQGAWGAEDIEIFKSLQYVGFDPEAIRCEFVLRAGASWRAVLKDVLIILSATGNNHAKLQAAGKVRSVAQGAEMARLIQTLAIKQKAPTSKSELTLPRIGVAFSQHLLSLNRAVSAHLQNQFSESQLAPELQNPCLVGIASVTNEQAAKDYHKAFSKALGITDEAKVEGWFKIIKRGHASDGINASVQNLNEWIATSANHVAQYLVRKNAEALNVVHAAPVDRSEAFVDVIFDGFVQMPADRRPEIAAVRRMLLAWFPTHQQHINALAFP